MIKPTVINRSYTCALPVIQAQSIVECRFPQPGEIAEIIAVSPQVSCSRVQAAAGRAEYGGRLVLSVVYSDDAGKLCRLQKGAEFSHSAEDAALTPSHSCSCCLTCEKLSVRREGSSFVISAVIGAEISAYERRERTYVTGAEGAYLNLKNMRLYSVVPFSGESEEEDSFDVDGVDDVLVPAAKACVQSAVCGTGEVTVQGEIYLSILAMRGDTPVTLERTIPYRAVIPADDSTVMCRADARVQITQLNVAATVNEERGKCEAHFSCTLSFLGKICDCSEEQVAADAFSPDCGCEMQICEEMAEECGEVKVYSPRISSPAATRAKLGYDCRFLTVALPEAECAFNPDTGCAEGEVRAVLIYEQGGEVKGTECQIPFAEKLSGAAEDGCDVRLNVAVCGVSLRLRAEGETEGEATLKITAALTRRRKVRYISELKEGAAREDAMPALSVCFPATGDGLWEVSKQLSADPSEVAELNPDVTFPLSGKERIVIYRGKKV